jgi:hypothetical protein
MKLFLNEESITYGPCHRCKSLILREPNSISDRLLAGVESLFVGIDVALAAEHNPEIVDGAGDQTGVVVKRGLILLEKVFEEREEVGRVLVCEEQRLRSAAVLQIVHAGGEFAGESFRAGLISHGPSFEARVRLLAILGR